ncbi:MBG domain-containing protein [Gordonibacter sp. 28C]|uniref:MBG domain-containing protein n=1 Tax=Gordonibacter sp. 28C TaxID=2078569 RepID=UPI0011C03F64|nr:MBG domain-containing protein [Gordonibacter sp. 28C]
METRGKRAFSMAMALALALGLVPAAAFAEEPGATPPAGETISSEAPTGGTAPGETPPEATDEPAVDGAAKPAPENPVPGEAPSSSEDAANAASNALGASAPTKKQHDFGDGSGPLETIVIQTNVELAMVGKDPAYPADANYYLASGVYRMKSDFAPIDATFTGRFDGNGAQIDLAMDVRFVRGTADAGISFLSMFRKNAGLIENLLITGAVTTSNSLEPAAVMYASALAYENSGTIRNVKLDCAIGPVGLVGGIACLNEAGGVIEGCTADGDLQGTTVGGIALSSSGRIASCESHLDLEGQGAGIATRAEGKAVFENCVNYGNITGTAADAAGCFLYFNDDARAVNCANYGAVANTSSDNNSLTGGILAHLDGKGVLENCENHGTVSGDGSVGGIVGSISPEIDYDCYVTGCVNHGAVSGTGDGVGGIAGTNNAGVLLCVNHGAVQGRSEVGGVIGDNKTFGMAQSLLNDGDVSGADNVGGIAGSTSASKVIFKVPIGLDHALGLCANYGAVTGTGTGCGGVVGYLSGHYLEDCFSEGDVRGNLRVGGVAGDASADIAYCYSTGDVEGENAVGGIAGDMTDTPQPRSLSDCYVAGGVSGSDDVGAFVGARNKSTGNSRLSDLYYNADRVSLSPVGDNPTNNNDVRVEGRTTDQMLEEGLRDELGDSRWSYTSARSTSHDGAFELRCYPLLAPFAPGGAAAALGVGYSGIVSRHDFESQELDGSTTPVFEEFAFLYTADDLLEAEHHPDQNYVLANDIYLGTAFAGLGGAQGYRGKFDGMGHTVTLSYDMAGLAAVLDGGRIMNVKVDGVPHLDSEPCGSLAGEVRSNAMLYNCIGSAMPEGSMAGGVAGLVSGDDVLIRACACEEDIMAPHADGVGGLVGAVTGDRLLVRDCNVETDQLWGHDYTGGLVGKLAGDDARISDCTARCRIQSEDMTGGLVGELSGANAQITNCSCVGEVYGASTTGGLVGGLSGANAQVEGASHDGLVSCWSGKIGGVVGRLSGVDAHLGDVSCSGKVVGHDATGGFVGELAADDFALASYTNTTPVRGDSAVGGIFGLVTGARATLSACANDAAVTVNEEAKGPVGIGGVAGQVEGEGAVLDGCSNSGAISGGERAGGIVGDMTAANAAVRSAANDGKVTGGYSTGGLVGRAEGDGARIESGSNTASVTGGDSTGGLVGSISCIDGVYASYNTGKVTGGEGVGGVAGTLHGPTSGGSSRIKGCANHAQVRGRNEVGGVVGEMDYSYAHSSVTESLNIGGVSAEEQEYAYVGGIVGRYYAHGTIKDCYSGGRVTAPAIETSYAGGIASYSSGLPGEVENCWYATEANMQVEGALMSHSGSMQDDKYVNVSGLSIVDMTGEDALSALEFSEPANWRTRANEGAASDGAPAQVMNFPAPAVLAEREGYPWPRIENRIVDITPDDLVQTKTYTGKPTAFDLELPGNPYYTVRYWYGFDGHWDWTEVPPTVPSDEPYLVSIKIDEPYYTANGVTDDHGCFEGHLTIEKAPCTIKADDQAILYGEDEPDYTYTVEGLVNGETPDVIDAVGAPRISSWWELGTHEIAFYSASDDCYDITLLPGTLTVTQDSAEGRFAVSGEKGGNGHDDWYVGPVTIAPDGRDGYDRIRDQRSAEWKASLTITSDTPQTVLETIEVKKSSTGAYTSKKEVPLNVCTAPLTLTRLSLSNGSVSYDPATATLELTFSQPVERGRGFFAVLALDGAELARLDANGPQVRISDDGLVARLVLPRALEAGTFYRLAVDGEALYSRYGARLVGAGEGAWRFGPDTNADEPVFEPASVATEAAGTDGGDASAPTAPVRTGDAAAPVAAGLALASAAATAAVALAARRRRASK